MATALIAGVSAESRTLPRTGHEKHRRTMTGLGGQRVRTLVREDDEGKTRARSLASTGGECDLELLTDAEDRHFIIMIAMMFLVLVLPGLLMMAYLIFNPDAFMYDITPRKDFSSCSPGKLP